MKNYKKILERLEYWKSFDDKQQKAMDVFCKCFSPDCYPMIINQPFAAVYIEGVSEGNKELEDYLGYYIWEAAGMKGKATITTKEGKKYNAKNKKEFIKFLENEIK